MMIKILISSILLSFSAIAQTNESLEEAILLNQELEFLENSAKSLPQIEPATAEIGESRSTQDKFQSLERTYFNDEEKDSVRMRTAAPKRKRKGF